MDAIERDLRSYGDIIKAAETRAAGLRKLLEDGEAGPSLKERGLDEADAEHLEAEAAQLKADLEEMRHAWARLQELAGKMHAESSVLADEVRSIDDAARSALGRKSEHLPVLGIRPMGRPRSGSGSTKAAATQAGQP